MTKSFAPFLIRCCTLWCALALFSSCRMSMSDQPRYEPLEASTLFADGASARPRVADTISRDQVNLGDQLHSGRIDGKFATTFPFTVTAQIVERGQERFNIFCAPCHSTLGDGHGVISEYGMRVPTSFHDPELRDQPNGYYFAIIGDGTRIMPSYASRIAVEDRWAIVAYIRALQLSQNADAASLPADELPKLEQSGTITK